MFNCDMTKRMFVMDTVTGELFVIKDKLGEILHVLDNEILSLHVSVDHGQELRRGRLVDGDMAETTTTTTTSTTTTTTTTTTQTTTTTTQDPCLEVVENEKKKLREEFLYNLTQYNITRFSESPVTTELPTTEQHQHHDHDHNHEEDTTTTTEQQQHHDHNHDHDHDHEEDTTTITAEVEVPPLRLREVEMIGRVVLSYNPYKDVSSETVTHLSDTGHTFSSTLYTSPDCLQNSKWETFF